MMMTRFLTIILIGLSLTTCDQNPENKLVERIDHVFTAFSSIQEVDSVIYIFNKVLNLPLWFEPDIRNDINTSNKFYNTGVYLGNVFFEFITFNTEITSINLDWEKPTYHAVVFSNALSITDEILEQREIKKSRKHHFAFSDKSGSVDTVFTTITLMDLNSKNFTAFFCQYHQKLFDWTSFNFGELPKISNPEDQHVFFKEQLKSKNGGLLKIKSAQKIILSSNSYEQHKQIIESILSPNSSNNAAFWRIEKGPSLQLNKSEGKIRLEAIYITVESLAHVERIMEKEKFEYERNKKSINLLTLSTLLGFDLILIE